MPNDDSISSTRPRAWQRAPGPATPPSDGSDRRARPGGVPPMFGFDLAMRPASNAAGQVRSSQTDSGNY